MIEKVPLPKDASVEQLHIIIGALYLSLGYAIERIAKPTDIASTAQFKEEFMRALKSGDIDMSILDDSKTFDLVVQMIESLFENKA
jgi:hypothetical protein